MDSLTFFCVHHFSHIVETCLGLWLAASDSSTSYTNPGYRKDYSTAVHHDRSLARFTESNPALHTPGSLCKFSLTLKTRLVQMNIYQQSLLEGRSFLRPSTPDAISNSSELSALLHLVIPGSDGLLPPIDMALINGYRPIEHLEPGFMQSSALPLPASSPAGLSELIISHNVQVVSYNTEPLFAPVPSWIESKSFLRPDPAVSFAVPQPDRVDAHDLVTLFEFNGDKLMAPFQDKSKLKQLLPKKSKDKCAVAGCNTKKQSNGRCIRHGGGRRCVVEGCTRGAQTKGLCKRHGGGARCKVEGCGKGSQGGGLCRTHGGGKLCTAPGCKKGAQRYGKCATHSSNKCSVNDCSSVARCRGMCSRHKDRSYNCS